MNRKFYILFLATTIFSVTQLQAQSRKQFKFSLTGIYGTASNFGGEIGLEVLNNSDKNFNNGFLFGIGLMLPLKNKGAYGESYNGTIYDPFPEDVYETGVSNNGGVYASLGYRLGRVAIGGRLGSSTKINYKNAYNNIMGLYSTSHHESEKLFGGCFIDVRATKHVGINIGYDNYNKATFGLGYRF